MEIGAILKPVTPQCPSPWRSSASCQDPMFTLKWEAWSGGLHILTQSPVLFPELVTHFGSQWLCLPGYLLLCCHSLFFTHCRIFSFFVDHWLIFYYFIIVDSQHFSNFLRPFKILITCLTYHMVLSKSESWISLNMKLNYCSRC